MSTENSSRQLTFRNASEHDISEVTISSGTHEVIPGGLNERVTYTVSYPGPGTGGGGGFDISPEVEETLAKEISEAVREKILKYRV